MAALAPTIDILQGKQDGSAETLSFVDDAGQQVLAGSGFDLDGGTDRRRISPLTLIEFPPFG